MKQIEFTRPMAPHGAGDLRLVDDDTADRLVAEGSARVRVDYYAPRVEPAEPPPPADEGKKRPVGRPRKYLTR